SVEALLQTCAELGIKLALKGDGSDRMLVDAPKGALTAPLREALASHKPEIIDYLKSQQSHQEQIASSSSRGPANNTWKSPEATRVVQEQSSLPKSTHAPQFDQANVE